MDRRSTRTNGSDCFHTYRFDAELQDWLCDSCGRSLGLVSPRGSHLCGPDCDLHYEVSGIG